MTKTVIEYEDSNGKSPFGGYLKKLRDQVGKRKILSRVRRIQIQGFFGDTAPVGDGLSEIRIHSGPGYRVYYGQDGDEVVILLCVGVKDSQDRDIAVAKQYWQQYKKSKPEVF